MINRVERDVRITRGEVNEVRETPGWERIRVEIVGPKEIAKTFAMEETIVSKRGIGLVAAN